MNMYKEISRTVESADYTSKHGVTLKLRECGHEIFVQGFPRSPIPSCFRINCKECAH